MPELPDVELYLYALERLLSGKRVEKAIVKSPFVLRTFDPPLEDIEGQTIREFHRIGKRIVWTLENCRLVFHLMIAGRYHWKKPGKLPNGKMDLIAFQFEHGTMMFTEASSKKRASLHVVPPDYDLNEFDRGGLEPLDCTDEEFKRRLQFENRTLKRALTDPRIFSGIGNAYSDEILLRAKLSPLKRTHQLSDDESEKLYNATRSVLTEWVTRLVSDTGEKFPEKVTAFRPEMLAHGKFDEICRQCESTKIQRIRYSENECNYCPACQTSGRLLADRRLSRLLKDDWPRSIEELEDS